MVSIRWCEFDFELIGGIGCQTHALLGHLVFALPQLVMRASDLGKVESGVMGRWHTTWLPTNSKRIIDESRLICALASQVTKWAIAEVLHIPLLIPPHLLVICCYRLLCLDELLGVVD